jgi:hypothetical protein
MGHIRYDIVPRLGGWSIKCGGVAGQPYRRREVAIRDAVWVADLLSKTGEEARVYIDGEPLAGMQGEKASLNGRA